MLGCGLEFAYDELKNGLRDVSGTFFLLLTDGADNKGEEKKDEMFERSQQEGFFIDTILLADEVDGELSSHDFLL